VDTRKAPKKIRTAIAKKCLFLILNPPSWLKDSLPLNRAVINQVRKTYSIHGSFYPNPFKITGAGP
jgi:hypothetical protein